MESDVAQSKLDGQQDRDAQFRGFSSYANCLNDRNHCRAAAPDFDHPKHSSRCERTQREFGTSGVGSQRPFAASRMNVGSRMTVSTHTDRHA